MDNLASGIKKFDGTGFEIWSTLMDAVLTAKRIKYVLDSDEPSNDSGKKFKEDDQQARAILLLSLDTKIVTLVLSCNTAREVWGRLKEVHSQQSTSCKMMLYQDFYSIQMKPGTSVSTYVADTELIVKKLRDIGVLIDDETLIGKIVSGLTSEFRHFMSNWMGTPEKERTYANLLPRLMAEETMLSRNAKEDRVALKASVDQKSKGDRRKQSKKDIECFHCKKKGHLKRDCRKLKREQADEMARSSPSDQKRHAAMAKSSDVKLIRGRFYFDSGASYHMTNDREWIDGYKVHERPIEILVGNNEAVYALGSGTIDVVSIVDGKKVNITLMDVQFVPAISENLYSQGACDRLGHAIITKGGQLNVVSNGETIIQGTRTSSNMYALDFYVPARANIARAERSLDEWHRVLGHPDINEVKNLGQKNCTQGFKIVENKKNDDNCGDCQEGKAHHASHPESSRERSSVPLHRVHADLVGPVEPPTLNHARYFMLLKDEFTSYLYVYFLKKKDETIEKLRGFFNEASIASQSRVQILRSDNGSEFKNASVKLLCDTEGVVQEFSAPRTPQQNGEIERANRTVLEAARTMLCSSGLPLNLWGEAVLTAVYLRNRLTNSRNRDHTPFELFYGKPPTYSHLIEFGKELHLLDTKRGESKFQSKTIEAYMVGYGNRNRTYRCYDPRAQDILISSDVIIAEHNKATRLSHIADRPQIVFPLNNFGNRDYPDEAPDRPGETSRSIDSPVDGQEYSIPEVSQDDLQRHCANQNLYVNEIRESISPGESARSDERELSPPNHGNEDLRSINLHQPAQDEQSSGNPHQPLAPLIRGRQQMREPATRQSDNVEQRPLTRERLPQPAHLHRTTNYTNLSQIAAPIRLIGRGTITTTSQTRPPNVIGVPTQTRPVEQTTGPRSSSGSRQVAAAQRQGGLSPSRLVERLRPNFEWTLRDREKRNVSSKYARLAMKIGNEPKTFADAMARDDADKWQQAVDVELAALAKNRTWKVVSKEPSTREISVKWVFKVKTDANGNIERYKARLVARGFSQVPGVDYGEVYAPVVHTDSLRLLFAICAQFNLIFQQFDIATAFLNGELDEVIHIQPPEGLQIPNGKTLRLLKSLYGLKQAPRCFNKKFKQVLNSLDMQQIHSDPCVFTRGGEEMIVLALYVDDGIVFAKDHATIEKLLNGLKKEFELKIVTNNFFLGLEIIQDRENSSVFLHQRAYAKTVLAKFGFDKSRAVGTPLEAGHSLNKPEVLTGDIFDCPYQELLGSLNYLATRTRPDIAFVLSICSKYADKPREQHWQALKRTLRYLQGTIDHGLIYKSVPNPRLVIYSDADYGGDHENRRSTSGMACFINTGLISYKAQQQQVVTMSTTEAEYIACTLAVKEIMWIKKFLEELDIQIDSGAILRCDNQSAIRLIKNSELHQRTKHIDIRHHFIRERYKEGLFEVEYVQTGHQLADIFTKALTKDKHQALCNAIGCVSSGSLSPGRVLECAALAS